MSFNVFFSLKTESLSLKLAGRTEVPEPGGKVNTRGQSLLERPTSGAAVQEFRLSW